MWPKYEPCTAVVYQASLELGNEILARGMELYIQNHQRHVHICVSVLRIRINRGFWLCTGRVALAVGSDWHL